MSIVCVGRPGLLPAPDPEVPCCWASVHGDDCACWNAILDRPRQTAAEGPSEVQHRMCSDCAYRAGSPERAGLDGAQLDSSLSRPFFCHDGMPRSVAYTHPAGVTVPAPDPGDFQPLIVGDRAWQASGAPAKLCAGWAAANHLPRGPR